jgi:FlgN protein.
VGNWETLVTLLAEMAAIYRAILELSRQKRDILIAVKPHELEDVTKKEEMLILQVGKMEAVRGKLVRQLAADSGTAVDSLTLTKMKELAGPGVCERLDKVVADFDQIMAELAPVNQLNAELIQTALTFINYNINLLAQNTTGPTYAAQGKTTPNSPSRKLFDKKA